MNKRVSWFIRTQSLPSLPEILKFKLLKISYLPRTRNLHVLWRRLDEPMVCPRDSPKTHGFASVYYVSWFQTGHNLNFRHQLPCGTEQCPIALGVVHLLVLSRLISGTTISLFFSDSPKNSASHSSGDSELAYLVIDHHATPSAPLSLFESPRRDRRGRAAHHRYVTAQSLSRPNLFWELSPRHSACSSFTTNFSPAHLQRLPLTAPTRPSSLYFVSQSSFLTWVRSASLFLVRC